MYTIRKVGEFIFVFITKLTRCKVRNIVFVENFEIYENIAYVFHC